MSAPTREQVDAEIRARMKAWCARQREVPDWNKRKHLVEMHTVSGVRWCFASEILEGLGVATEEGD